MSPARSAVQAPIDNVNLRRSRRSPRKRIRGSDIDLDDPESVESVKTVAKKSRWQPKPGKLAGLMNLPLDVLFEIFGHLNPFDLIRLARTTKQFRRVLMHRSSISVWKNARENVPNMPDCPAYWTEPYYANLAFDPHCHECGTSGVRNVDWRIGRRICAKCSKHCMVDAYPGGSVINSLVPSRYGKRGRLLFYERDVTEVQNKLDTLTDSHELEAYRQERRTFVKEMEMAAKVLEAWATSLARDRSEQLEDARRDRKTAIIEKLSELGWRDEIDQIQFRDDLSHHKLVKQPTRLTERIWNNIKNDMIKYMEEMKARRLERERKTLIITRKRIAIGVLRNYKIAHLPFTDVMPEPVDFCSFPEVAEVIGLPTETEVTEASFAGVVTQMGDLIREWRAHIHSQLRSRVKDHLSSTARRHAREDRTTPDPYYEEYLESLGAMVDVKGKKKEVQPPIPGDDEIDQSIPLATTVFRCKSCIRLCGFSGGDFPDSEVDDFLYDFGGRRSSSIPLFYPKVMGHGCLTKSRAFPWEYPFTEDLNFRMDSPSCIRTKWDCQMLHVDEEASKAARTVVEACGEDPFVTTATKMDELNPYFACIHCLKWSKVEMNQAGAHVFTWRQAVQHRISDYCRGPQSANWLKLEGELLEEVHRSARESKNNEDTYLNHMFDIPDPASTVFMCSHCMDLPQEKECCDLNKVKHHLLASHAINEPVENQDYYKNFEAPQGRKQDMKLSTLTFITLERERPSDVPFPESEYNIDEDDLGDDEDEDDFYFDSPFYFTFF